MRTMYVVALVVLGVITVTVIAYYVRLQVLKRKERTRIKSACSKHPDVRIFLEMISYDDAEATARTLASAFEHAACALHIRAGIYELFKPEDSTDVMAAYERQARSTKSPYVLRDHVRSLRVPVHAYRGVLTAFEQLERSLYENETYTCMVLPGTTFVPNWDEACVNVLRSCADPFTTALTTVPGAKPVMHNASTLGTFTVVEPHTGAFAPRAICKHVNASVASLPALVASSAFFFAPGPARLRALAFPKDLRDEHAQGVDTLALDYFINARLLSQNWTFVHSVKAVAFCDAALYGSALTGSPEWRARVKAANASFAAHLSARGIASDAHGALISANASMGLLPNATDAEIVAKLGTLDAFLSELSRLELETN